VEKFARQFTDGAREMGMGLPEEPGADPGTAVMRKAACEWAAFCLSEMTGPTLSLGLEISRAIAVFLNEIEDKPPTA
jgi:hypothetical protein